MTIYLQPDEETKWSKFSGYGCYCFQSYDNEFWKGQGLPKDDIDKWVFEKLFHNLGLKFSLNTTSLYQLNLTFLAFSQKTNL